MVKYDELKTPEDRRLWIEALHEKTHGPSELSAQSEAFMVAIGDRYDKESVLSVLTEIVGVEPVKKDSTYHIGDWEVVFDSKDKLQSMSASGGSLGMIIAERSATGDT